MLIKRFILPASFALVLIGQGCMPTSQTSNIDQQMEVKNAVIESSVNTEGVQGIYILPEAHEGKLPGVLVIHEWWGLNDQIKDEARNLAREGYAVFAIDLYDGEVATDATRAGELAGSVRSNPDLAEQKMKAALDYLESQPEVETGNLASLGWCFGGGMSGIIGSSGDDRLKATVIYYGTPVTDADRLSRMTQPVLGIWGADDQSISVDSVNDYEDALRAQGTDVNFYVYEGAGHAFANPTRSSSYRPEATENAWEKTLNFLDQHLRTE